LKPPTQRSICLGKDLLTGLDVRLPLTVEGNPHLLIAGRSVTGKTTYLLNLCRQMLDAGVRPIIFSCDEDTNEWLKGLVPTARVIDYGGDLGFNPLQVVDRQSRTAYLDVAVALRDIFVAVYPKLGPVQRERIRQAISESFVEQGWGDQIVDLSSLKEPSFGRFLEILRADPKPDMGLRTLLARLNELEDYGFFSVPAPRESLLEGEQPTVIRIRRGSSDRVQSAFVLLMLYGLYKDMFRRGIRPQITDAVVIDEVPRAASLSLIPTIAKECGKYGISLVLSSMQTTGFKNSLFSSIANYLVLRLAAPDAEALVRHVVSSGQKRALADEIMQLERFKALYFGKDTKKPLPVALPA